MNGEVKSWESIQGWFDFNSIYDQAVATAPPGARFVEIGAWLGRSTAYMAKQIADSGKRIQFDAVDTWDGGTDSPANARLNEALAQQTEPIYDQFLRNMKDCGVNGNVCPVKADSSTAASEYDDASLDFVFIDGDHSIEMVKKDVDAFWPKVVPGGVMAGHDINEDSVESALRVFCQEQGTSYYREGNSWIMEKLQVEPSKVLLGLPHPGQIATSVAVAAMMHPCAAPGVNVEVMVNQTSLLACGFNHLWSQALNRKERYFAMLHSDVRPERNWIDVLLAEIQRTGADLVSVVCPIKDVRGLTSTAIGHPALNWSPLRRLTMQEVTGLPPTFDNADVGYPDNALLVNTGCWLADLSNPKWREVDADGDLKTFFTIRDRVRLNDKGQFISDTQSEDWFFSAKMFENGLKAVATRKVQVGHYSGFPWPNYAPWGKWKHDNDTAPHWNQPKKVGHAE